MSAIQVTGTLARHAEARFTPDGTAWLCLEIHQGHNAVAARRRYDNSAASAIVVRSLARQLRQGSRVTVHAEHYTIELRPTPHLLLTEVSSIEPLGLATLVGNVHIRNIYSSGDKPAALLLAAKHYGVAIEDDDEVCQLSRLVQSLDAKLADYESGFSLTKAEANHLRRLLAWVRCEVGQPPEEMVPMVQSIVRKIGEVSQEGTARLVETYARVSNVPKYVRAALKALAETLAAHPECLPDAEDVGVPALPAPNDQDQGRL